MPVDFPPLSQRSRSSCPPTYRRAAAPDQVWLPPPSVCACTSLLPPPLPSPPGLVLFSPWFFPCFLYFPPPPPPPLPPPSMVLFLLECSFTQNKMFFFSLEPQRRYWPHSLFEKRASPIRYRPTGMRKSPPSFVPIGQWSLPLSLPRYVAYRGPCESLYEHLYAGPYCCINARRQCVSGLLVLDCNMAFAICSSIHDIACYMHPRTCLPKARFYKQRTNWP